MRHRAHIYRVHIPERLLNPAAAPPPPLKFKHPSVCRSHVHTGITAEGDPQRILVIETHGMPGDDLDEAMRSFMRLHGIGAVAFVID